MKHFTKSTATKVSLMLAIVVMLALSCGNSTQDRRHSVGQVVDPDQQQSLEGQLQLSPFASQGLQLNATNMPTLTALAVIFPECGEKEKTFSAAELQARPCEGMTEQLCQHFETTFFAGECSTSEPSYHINQVIFEQAFSIKDGEEAFYKGHYYHLQENRLTVKPGAEFWLEFYYRDLRSLSTRDGAFRICADIVVDNPAAIQVSDSADYLDYKFPIFQNFEDNYFKSRSWVGQWNTTAPQLRLGGIAKVVTRPAEWNALYQFDGTMRVMAIKLRAANTMGTFQMQLSFPQATPLSSKETLIIG